MLRTPDLRFELLAPRQRSRFGLFTLPTVLLVLLASLGWAIDAWREYDEARRASLAVGSRHLRAPVAEATRPSYTAEAWQAAKLLEAPVDAWLRELEHCQPDHAKTQLVRVDVVSRQVQATVRVPGDVDIHAWVRCLNDDEQRANWRLTQLVLDETASASGASSPVVSVTLGRSDTGVKTAR